MIEFWLNAFVLAAGALMIFSVICHFLGRCKGKKYLEYEKKIKESLKDEYIIDPETGIKLTLKEAETGKWDINEKKEKINVDTVPDEKDRSIEHIITYLRETGNYKYCELNSEQYNLLKETKIIGKYIDCLYNHIFSSDKDYILIITLTIKSQISFPVFADDILSNDKEILDRQLLYWIKIKDVIPNTYIE